ncbi:MAG TPA: DUF1302 domain-containing protein, partial [Candidatus Saccharimonadia bacterium]|nr:DUF1302 domain-containing protein [Candidatus Saccharimonadia bacterium]
MNKHNLYRVTRARALRKPVLASAIALALAAPAVQAVDFQMGEGWTGAVDTTVSYGVSMRMEDPAENLTGKARFNPLIGAQPNAVQRTAPGRFSVNSDDSSYNYPEDGDIFANTFKITSELSLNYEDTWGAFARASYFYDFENADKDELTELARDKVGERFTMLDAFVFYNFDFGPGDGSARLGRQVVSWGESTFIQNGINIINPIDVSKLRVAGAELKEAFLPVDMIFGSYNFNENFSMEALYLFEFEQTEPDPVGTYFATNDFATLGGTYAMLGFGLVPQPVLNPERFYDVCYGGQPSDNPVINTSAVLRAQACGNAIPRAEDRYPDDGGQYGLAFHYFSPTLMNTEFGFFFMNYHSRLPLISGTALRTSAPSTARVFIEYPEDIKMYGVSFNTTLEELGVALQGELSYKEDVPLQVDDVELLFFGLSPLNGLIPNSFLRFQSQIGNARPGEEFRGWERHEVSQLQITATRLFPNSLGAQQLAVVAEVGATNVWDLPDPSVLRYQGDGTDTGGGGDVLSGVGRNPITQVDGFPTKFSWGY